MQRFLKIAIYGLALALLGAGAPLLAVALPAVLGARALDRYFYKKEHPSVDGKPQTVGKVSRETALRRNGWNLSGLPLDVELNSVDGRRASFKAAGIDNLIEGVRSGRSAVYSMQLKDSDAALAMKELISEKKLRAEVRRDGDGRFVVVSHSLVDANILAKAAYPRKNVNVEREVIHGQQYLVEGVSSYEEAVALLQADLDNGRYLNSFVSVSDTVNGKKASPQFSGSRLDDGSFPDGLKAGSFIVTREEVTKLSGKALVPGNVNPSEMGQYTVSNVDSETLGGAVSVSERLVDDTPAKTGRYFVGETESERIQLRDPSSPSVVMEDGLKAYVVVPSMQEVADLLNDGKLGAGAFVVVSDRAPEVGAGKYLLEFDLSDPRVRDSVTMQNALPLSVQADLSRLGVEPGMVAYSRLVDKVHREGAVTCVLERAIDGDAFEKGLFEGTSLSEMNERLSDDRFVELNPANAVQWARDAAQIRSVNIELDVVKGTLKITSSVGDGTLIKTEERKLNEKEVESLSKRGAITKTEMKDLLIQLNPDRFKTYSDALGHSLLKDPLEMFLKGRKPSLVASVEQKRQTVVKTESKKSVLKR